MSANFTQNSVQIRSIVLLLVGLILISVFTLNSALASGDHGHGHEEEEEHIPEGPHGGRLVQEGDFSIEITMAESGIPAEFRVYAYQKDQPIAPNEVQLELLLNRLGNNTDKISFTPEEDYLVSEVSIAEPHSFEVEVHASFNGKSFDWHYDNFTGRTEINDRLLKLSGVQTQTAGSQTLVFIDTLFGIVAPITDKEFNVNAPYAGVIESLNVTIGDSVTKGQVIATVRNSTTLQTYQVISPADGQVTEQFLSLGDNTFNRSLLRISDLSNVWIDLSAFPKNIEKLNLGQKVSIGDDHGDNHSSSHSQHPLFAQSTISYIAPTMTGGHIARVRAVINNKQGHWRPGMHIQAKIETGSKPVPLAVRIDALQTFNDKPAVFIKHGNTFEVRTLTLGDSDGVFVEVLAGLNSDAEYVTENSYLLKADIMKDAAKHVH